MKKLFLVSSVLAIFAGVVLVLGGLWGICFTYKNVSAEKITTPKDASLPEMPVRGPLTLKSQADIIRTHTLKITSGKTYSEMPKEVTKLSQDGLPVLDENGDPVMVSNEARNIWITATALTTALNLGILTYVFSSIVILFGFISIWNGIIFWVLSRQNKFS
jgi:hypothetical protein